ncbi:MAG: InlB B-repeat-containing protein [Christensenellaceae bacterium]|jgi:uncharacterized repeat protein (TIGR02543 family)|nr:InlB B-repeat-containing protein [Christensenellaceae bacterium]
MKQKFLSGMLVMVLFCCSLVMLTACGEGADDRTQHVAFSANGGYFNVTINDVESNAQNPSCTVYMSWLWDNGTASVLTPTRAGYEFAGWFEDNLIWEQRVKLVNKEGIYDTEGEFVKVPAGTVLYAKWVEIV